MCVTYDTLVHFALRHTVCTNTQGAHEVFLVPECMEEEEVVEALQAAGTAPGAGVVAGSSDDEDALHTPGRFCR